MTMSKRAKKRGPKVDKSEELSPWRQLVVDVGADASEAVQGVLMEEGALGIELEDDETRAVPGQALAPTGRATVVATFSREPGLEARCGAALARVVPHFESAEGMEISWLDLWPEDWNAAFKEQWKPLPLSPRVWVVPSWESEGFELPDEAAAALHLDPGVAFGTGTHETTRLCAAALDEALAEGPIANLLDVGTGSGILSILALKLGAERANATEIDPAALAAAIDNARRNDVGDRFFATGGMPDDWGAAHDAVVANILAEPLLALAPAIAAAMKPGARLWLSGLLVEQEQTIRERYEGCGLTFTGRAVENEWLRLDLRK
jgi:ribosomal protein L11 methyltransferase